MSKNKLCGPYWSIVGKQSIILPELMELVERMLQRQPSSLFKSLCQILSHNKFQMTNHFQVLVGLVSKIKAEP